MEDKKTVAIAMFGFGLILGLGVSLFVAPITTARFYDELKKRALYSSDFICNEAKQTKFLYEQFKKKENK